MKTYPLEIKTLCDEIDGIVTIYSKGHHDIENFKLAASGELDPNWKADIPKIKKLIDREPSLIFAKTVGWFEDRERKGFTLSFSKEQRKGYFPVTVIDVY